VGGRAVTLDLEAIKRHQAYIGGPFVQWAREDAAALIAEVEKLRGLLEQAALWLPEGDPLAGPLEESIREALGGGR
jgi:hypothetical protein